MTWVVIAELFPDEKGDLWPRYRAEDSNTALALVDAEKAVVVQRFGVYESEDEAVEGAAVAQDFFYAGHGGPVTQAEFGGIQPSSEPLATEDNDIVDAYDADDEGVDEGEYLDEDDYARYGTGDEDEDEDADAEWLDDLPF